MSPRQSLTSPPRLLLLPICGIVGVSHRHEGAVVDDKKIAYLKGGPYDGRQINNMPVEYRTISLEAADGNGARYDEDREDRHQWVFVGLTTGRTDGRLTEDNILYWR